MNRKIFSRATITLSRRHLAAADRAGPAEEPSLQYWLPCDDAREHLAWICRFLVEERENILLVGCPGGVLLILDAPGMLNDPEIVRVAVDEARAGWDALCERVGSGWEALEIVGKNGAGAVLTRWDGDGGPRG